jgi:hypothetical protein
VTTVIDGAVVVEQIGQRLVSVSVTSRLQGIGSKYRERMISDGCPYANRKVLIKRVGENLLPTAQSGRLCRFGPSVAAPGTGNRHTDLFCNLVPGQALVAQLQNLLGGDGVSRRSAVTHGDAGTAKLMAYGGPGNAQLCTDLA